MAQKIQRTTTHQKQTKEEKMIPFGKQKVSQALPLIKLVAAQNNLTINRASQFKIAVQLAKKRYNQ